MNPEPEKRNAGEGAPVRRLNEQVDGWTQGVLARTGLNRGAGRMVLALVIAFAFFAILRPGVFLNPINIQNITVAAPEIGLIAIAMMLVMVTGGIDLSLVAIANFSAISMSTMYTALASGDPALADAMTPVIALVGIAVGLIGGAINGFLVSYVGITAILATLATMQIYNGLAIVRTGGSTLYGAPAAFTVFGKTAIGPIPMLFVAFLIVAVLVAVLVNRTPLGRKIQLQGANPVAARYSAIRSRSVLMSTYTTGGLLAGLAGILFLARNPTASADYGASYVLLVIVIAVLGGTNPVGGFATVAGVVLATLTLQVVSSGFTALRLSPYQYAIAQGLILIAVMVIDAVNWSRFARKSKPGQSPPAGTPAATPATASPTL